MNGVRLPLLVETDIRAESDAEAACAGDLENSLHPGPQIPLPAQGARRSAASIASLVLSGGA